jgi:histidine triad (HIT) family protein
MARHDTSSGVGCAFCDIVAEAAPAAIVREWPDVIAFVPLCPVVPGGHTLVVPRRHVADAVEDPAVTAATMTRAVELAAGYEASNILTSVGAAATQSIPHLHIHVIRRVMGDQLMVPWGTTGNPQDPHSCPRSARAEEQLAAVQDLLNGRRYGAGEGSRRYAES